MLPLAATGSAALSVCGVVTATVSAGLRRDVAAGVSSALSAASPARRRGTDQACHADDERRSDSTVFALGSAWLCRVSRRQECGRPRDVMAAAARGAPVERRGPAAAEGAVQRDPGGDALALQVDQR